MLGTAESAQFIYDWFFTTYPNGCDYSRLPTTAAPVGWKFLGNGGHRAVYLNEAEGVVYKVNMRGRNVEHDCMGNATEVENAKVLAEKAAAHEGYSPVRIPKAHAWEVFSDMANTAVVCAMQFIKDCKDSRVDDLWSMMEFLGFSDIYRGNVAIDENGLVWLIDMGGRVE